MKDKLLIYINTLKSGDKSQFEIHPYHRECLIRIFNQKEHRELSIPVVEWGESCDCRNKRLPNILYISYEVSSIAPCIKVSTLFSCKECDFESLKVYSL